MRRMALPAVLIATFGAALGGVGLWRAAAQPDVQAQVPRSAQTPGALGPDGSPAGQGLTLPQFQARMRQRLMRADTDGDGRISLAEWTAWRAAHPGHGGGDPSKAFARLDANGDGFVTPDEISAQAARRFARLDVDHDGVVTRRERMASRADQAEEPAGPVQPLAAAPR